MNDSRVFLAVLTCSALICCLDAEYLAGVLCAAHVAVIHSSSECSDSRLLCVYSALLRILWFCCGEQRPLLFSELPSLFSLSVLDSLSLHYVVSECLILKIAVRRLGDDSASKSTCFASMRIWVWISSTHFKTRNLGTPIACLQSQHWGEETDIPGSLPAANLGEMRDSGRDSLSGK